MSRQTNIRRRKLLLTSATAFFLYWLFVYGQPVAADIVFAARPMGPASNIYSVSDEGRIKKHTDDSRWRDLMAHVGPDGAIVFTSDRKQKSVIDLTKSSSSFDLFILDNDQVKQLTNDTFLEVNPQFSPNGRAIAYVQHQKDSHKLQVMDRDGSNTRTIATAQRITDFSWSPEGDKLVYATHDDGRSAVEVIAHQAKADSPQPLVVYSPHLHPNTADSASTSPFDGYGKIVTSAQWSPDGRKVAYIASSLERQERVLHVLDVESGENVQISNHEYQVQQPITWAADSKQLLYSALVDYSFHYDENKHEKVYNGGMQIFLSKLKGESRQLTTSDHLHNRPVFSPDGERIAYLFGEKLDSRSLSIRIMDTTGKIVREAYAGVRGDSFLFWTPSKKEAIATLSD